MLVKIISPKREKVLTEKKIIIDENKFKQVVDGYDFFRVIPVEEIKEYDTYDSVIKILDCNTGSILLCSQNKELLSSVISAGFEAIVIDSQEKILKTLEELYSQHKKPVAILFDYTYLRTNVHSYLKEIYIKQHYHLFRNIPLIITNYSGDSSPMIECIKILSVNGSPRKEGDTKRLLNEEILKYWSGPYYQNSFIDLENIIECVACGGHQKNCKPECIFNDQMKEIMPLVREADVMLLGSPVYMDMPTARTIAFLSRLTGKTKFNRREYIGKYASALSPGWCSGTKAVISSLVNALEMMGFTIQGRSTREYIGLWQDGKTRGGVPSDFYWPE